MCNLNYLPLSDTIYMNFFNLSELPDGYSLNSKEPDILVPVNWKMNKCRYNQTPALPNKITVVFPIPMMNSFYYYGLQGTAMTSLTLNEIAQNQIASMYGDSNDEYEYNEEDDQ